MHFGSSVGDLSRVNQWQICCFFVETDRPLVETEELRRPADAWTQVMDSTLYVD